MAATHQRVDSVQVQLEFLLGLLTRAWMSLWQLYHPKMIHLSMVTTHKSQITAVPTLASLWTQHPQELQLEQDYAELEEEC